MNAPANIPESLPSLIDRAARLNRLGQSSSVLVV